MKEENPLKKWITDVEKSKEEIEKLKTKDRLQTAAGIVKLHTAILASLQGWSMWLKNPAVLDQLSEEELKETFEVFKTLAIKFMDLDLKMSTSVMKKREKKKSRKRKKKGKETGYIS